VLVICNACGRSVVFPDEDAGSLQKCYYCNRETLVSKTRVSSRMERTENPLGLIAYDEPATDAAPQIPATDAAPAPVPQIPDRLPTPPPPVVLQPSETWGRRYLWLSLALIPLVFSLLSTAGKNDVKQRFWQTIQKLSTDEQKALDKVFINSKGKSSDPVGDLLTVLPRHRLEGAHLGADSWFHWVYGVGAAILFGGILIRFFPSPSSKPVNLIRAGLFTGTIGILLLLSFQIAAEVTQGVWLKGPGVFSLFFYIVKFIGFSYASALDPSSGFLLSCLGFTFGVGFCEEVCKLLPAIRRVRRWEAIDWRGVYLLGLASGMGFGISEGITYASSFNGLQTWGIYAVRFISCVMLHAVWSGAAAITLFKRQDALQGVGTWQYRGRILQIVAVPMVLHGLYDTLLKKQMDSLALVVAIVSFGWMAFQFERMRQKESQTELAVTT
jgi:RsiW-degrading membrane proteinase PrsW (M82 family)